MTSTVPPRAPASVARRAFPWFVLVAILLVGVALCLTLGQRVFPYFGDLAK